MAAREKGGAGQSIASEAQIRHACVYCNLEMYAMYKLRLFLSCLVRGYSLHYIVLGRAGELELSLGETGLVTRSWIWHRHTEWDVLWHITEYRISTQREAGHCSLHSRLSCLPTRYVDPRQQNLFLEPESHGGCLKNNINTVTGSGISSRCSLLVRGLYGLHAVQRANIGSQCEGQQEKKKWKNERPNLEYTERALFYRHKHLLRSAFTFNQI